MEFSKYIVAGYLDYESYMKAYNCKSKSAASIEAMKLLKRDDITAYIKELRKPLDNLYQNELISERKKRIEFIESRINECIKKDDEQSLIRWNEQLNKIHGLYKDTEQEQKPDSTVNNLDTDTLKKLSKIS